MQLTKFAADNGWIENDGASRRLGWGAIGVLAAAGPIFTSMPHLDVLVAGVFFDASRTAFAGDNAVTELFRDGFKFVYVLACAAAIGGLILAWSGARRGENLDLPKWLFLILCLAAGPGLVANLALKDQWGRARPKQIVEFGGTKAFSPALVPTRECQRNCSFVSGEASSIFMVFFAASFLFRRRTAQLIAAGVAGGMAAGLIRMAQGGHFLSDVVFAGAAMALTAVAIHQMFLIIAAPRVRLTPQAT